MQVSGQISLSKRELDYLYSAAVSFVTSLESITESDAQINSIEYAGHELSDAMKAQIEDRRQRGLKEVTVMQEKLKAFFATKNASASYNSKALKACVVQLPTTELGGVTLSYSVDLHSSAISLIAICIELYYELFAKAVTFIAGVFPHDKLRLIEKLVGELDFSKIEVKAGDE